MLIWSLGLLFYMIFNEFINFLRPVTLSLRIFINIILGHFFIEFLIVKNFVFLLLIFLFEILVYFVQTFVFLVLLGSYFI